MSHIKIYLPDILKLKKKINSKNFDWLTYYSKFGSYIGSEESIKYINKKITEKYDSKKN